MSVRVSNNEGSEAERWLASTAQAHERSALLYPRNSGVINFATRHFGEGKKWSVAGFDEMVGTISAIDLCFLTSDISQVITGYGSP